MLFIMNLNILKTKEVADILRVSPLYVRLLVNSGRIKAYKEGRKGGFRFKYEEVKAYVINRLLEKNQEIPCELKE